MKIFVLTKKKKRTAFLLSLPTRLMEAWDAEVDALLSLDAGPPPPWTQSEDGLPSTVAGVDVAYSADGTRAAACLVVLSLPACTVLAQLFEPAAGTADASAFPPYTPGYLWFRERALLAPLVRRALALPEHTAPEVVLIDGFGELHPRRAGSAVLCGRATGVPTVGVAKSMLVGARGAPPELEARAAGGGSLTWPVVGDDGQTVAVALRAHAGVTRPVWVSAGHRVPLDAAVRLVRAMARHRVCEPLRLADQGGRARVRESR